MFSKTAGVLALMATLVACGGDDSPAGQAAVAELVLPIGINEVKVSLVNKVSDPFWTGKWNAPQNEQDWREVEHLAYQVELGGALMKFRGTGPMDETWVSNPDWQQLAEQLSQDGARAVNAVRSRNRELMDRAGAQLIETCEACHRAFGDNIPTLDMYGSQVELPPVSL
ncbi:MAG: cytochrome c [Gammaproteobacteria bacterium]|nr:cytochrome c [Gammaproteobacteria bacterium]